MARKIPLHLDETSSIVLAIGETDQDNVERANPHRLRLSIDPKAIPR